MLRIDRRIDVTTAVRSGEELYTVASVVAPEANRSLRRPVVYVAYPGGSYNRHYYDLQLEGHLGYSQAEFHVAEGDIFVCCDHLAVGDSDSPTVPIDFEAVGRANAETARTVVGYLAAGDLHPELAPVEPAAVIGIGQSMGGLLLTISQAADPLFDGVALLGWSGVHGQQPWPKRMDRATMLSSTATGMDHPMRPWFHHDDEPADLVVMDMTRSRGSIGSTRPWGTSNGAGGPAVSRRDTLAPGVVAAEAAAITVPVFVGCGEIDVIGDPWSEPSAYRGSRDVTVAVFERMAHMHNFAPTRADLWHRLRAWANGIACAQTTAGQDGRGC